ncbi:ArsR/SmtB family transcription factor [Chloroflexota bacterium]
MPAKYNFELYKLKAELCKAFADPKRLMIINELRQGERLVGDLSQTLQISQAVTSRHLAVLRHRGAVTFRREGTNVYYNLADLKIGEACELVHDILLNQMTKRRELTDRLIA